ncbi:hypothetical protein ABXY91_004149 [Vibrio fluvialis]
MFTGDSICSGLNHNDKCFKVYKYDEGMFVEVYHEHVPAHGISRENQALALKALVLNNTEVDNEMLLRSFLNKRSKSLSHLTLFKFVVDYPEPGVMRTHCSMGSIRATLDEVIVKGKFRTDDLVN